MDHEITDVTDDGACWTVVYFAADDTERERGVSLSVPYEAVANRMALLGITDPREALRCVLETEHWNRLHAPADPRDDPALAAGWVTSRHPSAVAIDPFTARSTADAGGAHAARIASSPDTISDPGGMLPDPELDPADVRRHAEDVDTLRWMLNYGDLPEAPLDPMNPMEEEESRG